jgi:hypothetical protein
MMQKIFRNQVFETEADQLLNKAYAELPDPSTYPAQHFPKKDVTVPSERFKGFSLKYRFELYRAPDNVRNNAWNTFEVILIETPPAPKKKESKE